LTQDTELVRAILAGNDAAFARLVELYQQKLYTVAYGVTGNSQDALDVVQDTFIKAWCNLASWRSEGPLSAWLCRIATNLALDHLRKRKRLVPAEQLEWNRAGADVEAEVIEAETAAELKRAVDALPEAYRLLIVLRHSGNFSYQEMADMLGITLSQVKNRLHRARKMLKKRLWGGQVDGEMSSVAESH